MSLSRASQSSVAAASGFIKVTPDTNIAAADITQPIESSSAASASALEVTALNFYHIRDGKPGQDYTWLKDVKLIEPHRDTTLAVVGPCEGFDYRWECARQSTAASTRTE